jgi:MFS family permease
MNKFSRWFDRFPSPVTMLATGCVIAGFLLAGISWWFLALSAVGAFGPGLLRELGWLCDKDEFQIQAARRAGYHAFLAAGVVAFLMVAFVRSNEQPLRDAEELASLLLAVMGFTWLLSSLLSFWGAVRGACTLLYILGTAWLLFLLASNLGSEWSGFVGLVMQLLIAVPFFALAVAARFYPRVAGALLLLVAVGFLQFFGFFQRDNLSSITQLITGILLVGPLIGAGLALLASRSSDQDAEPKGVGPQGKQPSDGAADSPPAGDSVGEVRRQLPIASVR